MRSETNSEVLTLKSPRGPNVPAAPRNHLTTSWPRPRQKSMDSGIFAGSVFSVESVPVPSSPLSPGGTGGRCGSLNPLVSCLVRNAYWGREKKKGM